PPAAGLGGGRECCPRRAGRGGPARSRRCPPRRNEGHGMKAMTIREHGGLDRLASAAAVPEPSPGPGDVLVRGRATSLNYHDVFTLKGIPGIKIPMPTIMGLN